MIRDTNCRKIQKDQGKKTWSVGLKGDRTEGGEKAQNGEAGEKTPPPPKKWFSSSLEREVL